jgi:hypothetical protein
MISIIDCSGLALSTQNAKTTTSADTVARCYLEEQLKDVQIRDMGGAVVPRRARVDPIQARTR